MRISDWSSDVCSSDLPAAQLIYPSRGVMILETAAGCWVVPPQQACWLPSNENHRVQTSAGFEMLSVYCRGSVLRRLPEAPGVVAVSRDRKSTRLNSSH